MKPSQIIKRLLETEDDVNPLDYLNKLECKRDVVNRLVKLHTIKHLWQDEDNWLLVVYPNEVRFPIILFNHGVGPDTIIDISKGSRNTRKTLIWYEGTLDQIIPK